MLSARSAIRSVAREPLQKKREENEGITIQEYQNRLKERNKNEEDRGMGIASITITVVLALLVLNFPPWVAERPSGRVSEWLCP